MREIKRSDAMGKMVVVVVFVVVVVVVVAVVVGVVVVVAVVVFVVAVVPNNTCFCKKPLRGALYTSYQSLDYRGVGKEFSVDVDRQAA